MDGEPDLDLVEPGSVCGRVVEVHVPVPRQPAIAPRLMSGEVVEDDAERAIGIRRNDAVHEVEELDAPPSLVMLADHLAGGNVQRGEQRRGAMPLVVVRLPGYRPAIRQLQVALGTF